MKLFSFVGDLVLDPFMGSGSTLLAASQCNRRSVGIEIDFHYCNLAIRRIEEDLVRRKRRSQMKADPNTMID